jgi:hypothetical protein
MAGQGFQHGLRRLAVIDRAAEAKLAHI